MIQPSRRKGRTAVQNPADSAARNISMGEWSQTSNPI